MLCGTVHRFGADNHGMRANCVCQRARGTPYCLIRALIIVYKSNCSVMCRRYINIEDWLTEPLYGSLQHSSLSVGLGSLQLQYLLPSGRAVVWTISNLFSVISKTDGGCRTCAKSPNTTHVTALPSNAVNAFCSQQTASLQVGFPKQAHQRLIQLVRSARISRRWIDWFRQVFPL